MSTESQDPEIIRPGIEQVFPRVHVAGKSHPIAEGIRKIHAALAHETLMSGLDAAPQFIPRVEELAFIRALWGDPDTMAAVGGPVEFPEARTAGWFARMVESGARGVKKLIRGRNG